MLLSHDLATIFNLQKAATEIGNLSSRLGNVGKTTFVWLELKNNALGRFSRSEYTKLLSMNFYDFISEDEKQPEKYYV